MGRCTYITDLKYFSHSNLKEAETLLRLLRENGLPEGVDCDELEIMLNTELEFVFLTNSSLQVVLENNGKLGEWLICPECKHEGFLDDFVNGIADDSCCRVYLRKRGE